MGLLGWLAKVASKPLVAKVLVPALSGSLAKFFARQAERLERKAAYRAAKAALKIANAAKKAEALRAASRQISDLSDRR